MQHASITESSYRSVMQYHLAALSNQLSKTLGYAGFNFRFSKVLLYYSFLQRIYDGHDASAVATLRQTEAAASVKISKKKEEKKSRKATLKGTKISSEMHQKQVFQSVHWIFFPQTPSSEKGQLTLQC